MKNRKWLGIAALLAFPALAGCGGSSSSSSGAPLVPRSVSATLPNGLTGTLTEDRSVVSIGGTVTYTATLTNATAQPITYQYYSGPGNFARVAATLSVTDPSGQVVFPFGPASLAVGIIGPTTLAPGQSVSSTIAVGTSTVSGLTVSPGYAASGQYTANADFLVVPGAVPGTGQIAATAGPLPVTAQ